MQRVKAWARFGEGPWTCCSGRQECTLPLAQVMEALANTLPHQLPDCVSVGSCWRPDQVRRGHRDLAASLVRPSAN